MSVLPVGSFVGNDSVGVSEGPWDDIQGRITLGDAHYTKNKDGTATEIPT